MGKKILSVLLCIILVLSITGCKNKESENKITNKTTTKKIEVKENVEDSNVIDDSSSSSKTEVKDNEKKTSKSNTTKKQTMQSTTTTTTIKTTEKSCIAKKFNNTYSYVYSTYEECKKNGSSAFEEVYQNKDDTIFSYGCSSIVDDCGTTWYGVYFNRYSNETVIKVYY